MTVTQEVVAIIFWCLAILAVGCWGVVIVEYITHRCWR